MLKRIETIIGIALAAIASLGAVWFRYDAKKDARKEQEADDAQEYAETFKRMREAQAVNAATDLDAARQRMRDRAGLK
jgi:hypothetical protein